MSSGKAPITSAVEIGWGQPGRLQNCCGEHPDAPPLLSGGIMLQQGESLALGQPPRPDSKTKTFPSPDKVLRLPAEMQLKQLIF